MVKRVRIELEGFVQGVGFRPFVYRLAHRFGLKGFVKNVTSGVVIEAEGDKKSIDDFLVALEKERPKPSRITRISREFIEPVGDISFSIISSEKRDNIQGDMVPDLATCEDCLREMLDPSDRRYLYPFINCTNCGPRFTIIESLPYDRPSTTMREFTMCNACQAEYDDPLTRRFHAQPNACVICGPSYTLTTDTRVLTNISAIRFICDRISDGEIVAVKGVGGYHLVCDATNSVPLEKLRKAKARPFKPFACMVRDKKTLEKLVQLDEKGWELLSSPAAPIVLLRKTEECDNIISPLVAPGLSHLGVMLPYAPIHHLLFHIGGFDVLVATSANRQDEPITIDNAEAIRTLNGIASYFLTHNRRIHNRADDSVISEAGDRFIMVRRSRGYAPESIQFPETSVAILGTGAEEKVTFTLASSGKAFMSQFIGDLDNNKAIEFYRESFEKFKSWLKISPELVATDMHPDFFTTIFADELGVENLNVQHHYAHALAVLAEHNINHGTTLGVVFDGFGLGPNNEYWGGELILANTITFERVGSLRPFKAISPQKLGVYPNRSALSFILSAGMEIPDVVRNSFDTSIFKNMIKHFTHEKTIATSAGRLFDAVASILGICHINTYESEAPQRLESLALRGKRKYILPFDIFNENGVLRLDWEPILKYIMNSNDNHENLALSFHYTIASAIFEMVKMLKKRYGFDRVVISGGCFQNRVLFTELKNMIEKSGISFLYPVKFPPNDGSISLGQAFFAAHWAIKNR